MSVGLCYYADFKWRNAALWIFPEKRDPVQDSLMRVKVKIENSLPDLIKLKYLHFEANF